mmetsp:Transcript_20429/g.61511  ORF Transcript_20429/g.61511 Transcript_20429/m.61511 type:complete len:278 (-) Transcript_20429:520-1353(-)
METLKTMPARTGVELVADRLLADSRNSRPMPNPTVLVSLSTRCPCPSSCSFCTIAARTSLSTLPTRKLSMPASCAANKALYSASCCLLGSTSSVRDRLAQYDPYRAPMLPKMMSYRSRCSLLVALTLRSYWPPLWMTGGYAMSTLSALSFTWLLLGSTMASSMRSDSLTWETFFSSSMMLSISPTANLPQHEAARCAAFLVFRISAASFTESTSAMPAAMSAVSNPALPRDCCHSSHSAPSGFSLVSTPTLAGSPDELMAAIRASICSLPSCPLAFA